MREIRNTSLCVSERPLSNSVQQLFLGIWNLRFGIFLCATPSVNSAVSVVKKIKILTQKSQRKLTEIHRGKD